MELFLSFFGGGGGDCGHDVGENVSVVPPGINTHKEKQCDLNPTGQHDATYLRELPYFSLGVTASSKAELTETAQKGDRSCAWTDSFWSVASKLRDLGILCDVTLSVGTRPSDIKMFKVKIYISCRSLAPDLQISVEVSLVFAGCLVQIRTCNFSGSQIGVGVRK